MNAAAHVDTELDFIRAQLLDLEYADAANDRMRRRLQARRAQLLEETEGCYATH